MKPASVGIADVVRTGSYFDGICGIGIAAMQQAQGFMAFNTHLVASALRQRLCRD
jgi:hypothetical protein